MLEAKGIGYRYNGENWVFRNINLCIGRGEVVGLSGPSGSGKTTMAKMLAGYLHQMEGNIRVNGKEVEKTDENLLNPVQLIWQHPEKTVNPMWKMSKIFSEVGIKEANQDLLAALHIEMGWFDRYPRELSGGQLQRLCLLRALLANPRYLIADEATTMLDVLTQAQIWNSLLKLAEQYEIGILAISHDSALLDRISQRKIDFIKMKEKAINL